jgi:voltage-gated potassium channel
MKYPDAKLYVYEVFAPRLGGQVGKAVDWGIIGLIIINIIAVLLETVDPIANAYAGELYAFEVVSVCVFTVEYFGRIWSITEARDYENPLTGRIRFMINPMMLIDLIAILPFYLASIFAIDTRFLRALRLVRVVRLLKVARYSKSMRSFGAVFRSQKEKLVIAAFADMILLVIASSIMYQLEHGAQPELFSSIPAALWWGAMTLTTVGYGDMYPVTPMGQVAGSLIAVFGIGLFALPASILAAGFIEDSQEEDENEEAKLECPHCGEMIYSSD